MERDDPDGDERPNTPLLPPDDRLWRHPSEVAAHGPAPVPAPPSRGPRPWMVAAVASSVGALLATGVLAGTGVLTNSPTVLTTRPPILPAVSVGSVSNAAPAGVTDMAGRLTPAVVRVRAEGPAGALVGTGMVLREDGHVLTAHQPVAGATSITVVLGDGAEVAGYLVGADADTNLAVVKVERAGLPVAPLATGEVAVGDPVTAVGCTGTAGALSMAGGTVHGVDGELVQGSAAPLLELIETDTADTGTSGGPLLDARGDVAGVIVGRSVDGAGTARTLATPILYAVGVANQLIAVGRVVRPWIGIEGADLDATSAGGLGVAGGAVVRLVKDGGPGAGAGLAAGDVILAMDGAAVASMADLKARVRTHQPGDVVRLTVLRAAGRETVDVTLAERPPS